MTYPFDTYYRFNHEVIAHSLWPFGDPIYSCAASTTAVRGVAYIARSGVSMSLSIRTPPINSPARTSFLAGQYSTKPDKPRVYPRAMMRRPRTWDIYIHHCGADLIFDVADLIKFGRQIRFANRIVSGGRTDWLWRSAIPRVDGQVDNGG